MSRRGIVWLALSLAALAVPPAALAQSGIIRVIIGTVPGGAIDPYARMIAENMSRTLGQPIIVESKPGASGTLAAEYVANAPADGTILWLGTQAFTEINPNAFPNARWSIDQFRPIIRGVEAPLVFRVHPSVPADTFGEFITWAKANRGEAELLVLSGRNAVTLPRLPDERKVHRDFGNDAAARRECG